MMATMSVTSPSQEVARRLINDGHVVVTGMMSPDGARDARADLNLTGYWATTSSARRSASASGEEAQILHRDDSIYPVPEPHPPLVVNTMWPLDEFTAENGATRFIPGSHQWAPARRPG
jgi:hypothetical protein